MKQVDPATDDLAALAMLHAACFDDAWDCKSLASLLTTPGCFGFATDRGFVLVRAAGDEAEILTLAVAPDARGQGLGRALVSAAAAHVAILGVTAMFLEVRHDNKPALAVYAALGFQQVGQRKGYYAGRDAWILKAGLPLPQGRDFA